MPHSEFPQDYQFENGDRPNPLGCKDTQAREAFKLLLDAVGDLNDKMKELERRIEWLTWNK